MAIRPTLWVAGVCWGEGEEGLSGDNIDLLKAAIDKETKLQSYVLFRNYHQGYFLKFDVLLSAQIENTQRLKILEMIPIIIWVLSVRIKLPFVLFYHVVFDYQVQFELFTRTVGMSEMKVNKMSIESVSDGIMRNVHVTWLGEM